MATSILLVESRPANPDVVDEFNRWYDEVHLPELLALDGVVAARRYAPTEEGDPYLAVYELEGDPKAVIASFGAAATDGRLTMSDAMQMDPQPKLRVMQLIAATAAG
ncbi:hypothetical protein E1200_01020 [Actinomadura sp. GC306]|uniref:DUF4286 family protein n=1 Tax=Actinomadura sp. GC306 TaxID=2530367 RepID=UPI00104331EC|nr:DUF4286 family protein [Actinomadura sp. GC306]TDC71822.1 hypothetical protein E1200_01020 [Actinomadura sp. GC306]